MSKNLVPQKLTSPLANTPEKAPLYGIKVKNLSGEELCLADPKATRALVALMNQHATIGGAACHWGGPAAFAEIMSATHALMFQDKSTPWHQQFNFVNDAGHAENGIYALRANYGFDDMNLESLKGFRSLNSKLTGHGEAHINPAGVLISNGPLGSGLPQAQGLAIADSLIGNNRVTLCALSDGASSEGEAKESFASIPGLAGKDKLNPFILLISDNNTKLSGRIDEDSYSQAPTFDSLESLGWTLQRVQQGHHLETVLHEIEKAIANAKANPQKPIAIIFKTIKGYGVQSTQDSLSGGHGYPLKAYDSTLTSFLEEIYSGSTLPEEFRQWSDELIASKPSTSAKAKGPTEKVQVGIAKAAIECRDKGLPVFSVSADLQGSTGMKAFHQAHPGAALDLGVSESNMISTAIGLSKQGFIPIVDTFAQFGITKGALPFIMAGLSQAPVIAVFSHIGFQDAADGASHQSTTYFSMTASLPYTDIISLSCSEEAYQFFCQAVQRIHSQREKSEHPHSVIFFLGRESYPVSLGAKSYQWGKMQVLKKGTDLVILTTGPLLPKALKASELLAKKNISATIINNPFVNKVDTQTLKQELQKANGRLLTVEDHQIKGGMGALTVHAMSQEGDLKQVKSLGVHGLYGQSAYKADHLYQLHELDEQAIFAKAMEWF